MQDSPTSPAAAPDGPICLLVNSGSGTNRRDGDAAARALDVLGPQARMVRWHPGRRDLPDTARAAGLLVAAGGETAIAGDEFAVLVARAEDRRALFRVGLRLAMRRIEEGRDYDLIRSARIDIDLPRRRAILLAHDGEKARTPGPLRFEMSDKPLRIILPPEHPAA